MRLLSWQCFTPEFEDFGTGQGPQTHPAPREGHRPTASEDVDRVELQSCQPGLCARQWTTDQCGRAQLHAAIELVETINSMLCDIRSLPDVAVVEVAEHRFALDVNPRITDLPIAFLLQTAHPALRPVSAALVGNAVEVLRLRIGQAGRIRRRGNDVGEISAGLCVLHVVADEQ